jgi:plastocyanin
MAWTCLALVLTGCGDDSPPAPDRGAVDRGAGGEASLRDAGPREAAPGDQGAAPAEAAAGGCSAGFASCTSFSDGTAGTPTISFPGLAYDPKCLRLKVGQAVSFSGSFSAHPLEQACGPAPVIASTSSGTSASFSFSKPGLYGYYCTLHGTSTGSGMAGAIEVVP